MTTKELTTEEMQSTNGGGLLGLGGDKNQLEIGLQIGLSIETTDSDGNRETHRIEIGLGNTTTVEND